MPKLVQIKAVAHHEAGHAFARWWLGHYVDSVQVLSLDQLRAGVMVRDRRGREVPGAAGIVTGYEIFMPHARQILDGDCSDEMREILLRRAPIRVEMDVLVSHAGPQAEAAHRRCSAIVAYLYGGEDDLKAVREVSMEWFGSNEARAPTVIRAEKLARALVRSTKAQIAIEAMAVALLERGEIDGELVNSICGAAYGGAELVFDRWDHCWPPTLKQIREGFLPERVKPLKEAA